MGNIEERQVRALEGIHRELKSLNLTLKAVNTNTYAAATSFQAFMEVLTASSDPNVDPNQTTIDEQTDPGMWPPGTTLGVKDKNGDG